MPTPDWPHLAAHPTEQQLDELEALMQRMLALPVNSAEDPPLVQPPSVSLLGSARKEESTQFPRQTGAGQAEASTLSAPSPRPVRESKAQEFNGPIRMPVSPGTPHQESKTRLGLVEWRDPGVQPAGDAQMRISGWLKTLLWINQAYDGSTKLFGSPGRRLRGPRARALLGSLGIVLLALAVTWVLLDKMGWSW
jgi:hypothetical protein